jgi:hypothetical protein
MLWGGHGFLASCGKSIQIVDLALAILSGSRLVTGSRYDRDGMLASPAAPPFEECQIRQFKFHGRPTRRCDGAIGNRLTQIKESRGGLY